MNANVNSTLRELLCDRRAYTAFRYSAWCMVPLALIVLIALTPLFDTITANIVTRIGFQIISACVGVVGTIAGMVLFVGMLAYLFLLDRSSPWKIAWLIVFLFTAW